jgi:hypothetical protein
LADFPVNRVAQLTPTRNHSGSGVSYLSIRIGNREVPPDTSGRRSLFVFRVSVRRKLQRQQILFGKCALKFCLGHLTVYCSVIAAFQEILILSFSRRATALLLQPPLKLLLTLLPDPSQLRNGGAALLATLEKGLGKDFTPAVREAWVICYTLIAREMIEGTEPREALP